MMPKNVMTFWWSIIASKEKPTNKLMILARNFKIQIIIISYSHIGNIYQVFIQKLLKNDMCWDTYERHQLSHLTVMLCLSIYLPLPAAQRGKDMVNRCVQSIIWSFEMPVNMRVHTKQSETGYNHYQIIIF